MNFQDIVYRLGSIQDQIEKFESGDLMTVLDIKDSYLALQELVKEIPALKDISRFIGLLSRVCMKLSGFGSEEETLSLLVRSNQSLLSLFNKEKAGEKIAVELNEIIHLIRELMEHSAKLEKNAPVEAEVEILDAAPPIEDELTDVETETEPEVVAEVEAEAEPEVVEEVEAETGTETEETAEPVAEVSVVEEESPVEETAVIDETISPETFTSRGVAELFQDLKDNIIGFQNGDLMGVVEIREGYGQIAKKLEDLSSLKQVSEILRRLSETGDRLSQVQDEMEILPLLYAANKILDVFFAGEKTVASVVEEIGSVLDKNSPLVEAAYTELRDIIDAAQAALSDTEEITTDTVSEISPAKSEKAEEKDSRFVLQEYSPGYFSHIVDDKKMLSQLADEIKEHLNNAQVTLLELEDEPANQENINKVFRSFHTIKGSSAFLGLKNIEDVGHVMEDLLVLVRDGKLPVSMALIDLSFEGIELFRQLVGIMEDNDFRIEDMKADFETVDIFSYIGILHRVLEQCLKRPIGEILRELGWSRRLSGTKDAEMEAESAADQKQASSSRKRVTYVKVSNERLNTLVDIVGELVINQSMLRQIIDKANMGADTEAERTITQLEGITTNIKNLVLSMGMVPIADVFNKLKVVIRNTATELNKPVTVDISGEDTELDRNVVESIYDPLMHIVRNSVDHGIESEEERVKTGKNRTGHIRINAEHKGNGIEISVHDDGRGISRDKILRKALEKRLVAEEQTEAMTNKEVYNLMFLPGFSTAEKVTEVSGRGVGLDVVKKNIDEIHGKVEVMSEEGKGSRFMIRLPLTLAIIEGFVITVGKNNYVLPFNAIEEIIVPQKEQLSVMDDGSQMLFNRGIYIPLIYAGSVFKEEDYSKTVDNALVVVLSYENNFYGVVVDKVVGKQEIVIKNLGESLQNLSIFSGGTIFGDGAIGFVVDFEGFLEAAKNIE